MRKYEDWSEMSLEEEYVRVSRCAKCTDDRRLVETELVLRGYLAREIRNVRKLARS